MTDTDIAALKYCLTQTSKKNLKWRNKANNCNERKWYDRIIVILVWLQASHVRSDFTTIFHLLRYDIHNFAVHYIISSQGNTQLTTSFHHQKSTQPNSKS